MLINILQEDIDQGVKAKCHLCPIAQALTRIFGDCHPEVDIADIWFRIDGKLQQYTTTNEARRFMSSFDRGLPVKPITLELQCLST